MKAKLVRDNIPEIISSSGRTPITDTLTMEEFKKALIQKLKEESCEFEKDPGYEEMADILEVIDFLMNVYCLDVGKLNKIREQKRIKNGSFEKKILLKDIK